VVGLGVAWLAVRAWRWRGERISTAVLSLIAAGLFVAQVLIGAALVWSAKSAPAVVAHVTVSSLVWGALVGAAALARVLRGAPLLGADDGRTLELAVRR
jgi:heme A synthase